MYLKHVHMYFRTKYFRFLIVTNSNEILRFESEMKSKLKLYTLLMEGKTLFYNEIL